MKLYVPSSTRNVAYSGVLEDLRAAEHEITFNWRDPEFRWEMIDPRFQEWTSNQYAAVVRGPSLARAHYERIEQAIAECDACVLLLPAGTDAHGEAMMAAMMGKPVVVFFTAGVQRELVHCRFNATFVESTAEMLAALAAIHTANSRLPPIKQRIYDAVRRHPGITAEQLRCLVWADDPNGGPEDRKVLHVHISQLNDRLAARGIEVRASGGEYRVRAISRPGCASRPPNPRRGARSPQIKQEEPRTMSAEDDFMRQYEAHLNDPDNLRRRHAKLDRMIASHRDLAAKLRARKEVALFGVLANTIQTWCPQDCPWLRSDPDFVRMTLEQCWGELLTPAAIEAAVAHFTTE